MKKNYLHVIIALVIASVSPGQTPTYSNQAGGIANAFPLNNTSTAAKVQWFIPAASLGTLSTGLYNITNVWFQAGSNATQVYPVINVKLKTGTGMTSLSGTTVEPNMNLVYTAANYTLTTTTGTWFMFPLQTPFVYDPSQPLIVEMEHSATSGTGPTVYQTAISASGATRQYASYNATSLTGSDATRRINFGIDVTPYCNLSIMSSASGTANAAICSGATLTLTTNGISNYSWSTGSTASSIVINPTVTMVYSLTATSPSNCTASKAYTVNVSSSVPVLTVASSANTVCLGKTATLTATGALSYTWSHGAANGGTFTPSTTAVYTVTGENGCGTSSATISIAVGPIPVNIVSNTPSVCAGTAAIFTVNAAASSFTWLPQNAVSQSTIIAVSPTANTVYSVAVSDGTCSGSGTISLVALPVPTISIVASGSTVCQGDAVSLTASGGNNYTWTPSSLNGTVVTDTPTTATLYQVTGDNSFGCTATANHVVIVQMPPAMTTNFSNTVICSGGTAFPAAFGAGSYTWSTGANTSSIQITAITNTVFTVTGGHGTNSCVATKTLSVTAVSVALQVSSNTVICKGAQATLSVNATNNISWSPQGGGFQVTTVNPSVSTIYTVTANVSTMSLMCPGQNTVEVIVNPNPTVSATAQRTVMCRNEKNQLTASGATSYTWQNQQTGATMTYTATQNGLITLTLSGVDNNGCKGTGSVKIQVNSCTGLEEYVLPSVRVYPVPSSGAVFIESDAACELRIVAVTGQVVKIISSGAENSNKVSVSLEPGVYFLRSAGGLTLKTFIIE